VRLFFYYSKFTPKAASLSGTTVHRGWCRCRLKALTEEELAGSAAGREVNWVDALENRDNKAWVINNADRVIPPIYCCPKCRSRNVHNYDLGNAFVMRVQCHDCGYYGERGAISETEIKY